MTSVLPATDRPEPADNAAVQTRSGYRWYFLSVLVMIYAVQHLDRQILSILIEPLKREFGLSDTQLGFLTGSCYAVSYAVAGIPLGMLGDRVNRRNLLAVMLAIWSGMTALSGLARNLSHLMFARLFVGAAESANMPLAMSMLSDMFTRKQRSSAFGIYWLGVAVGGALGPAMGGPVAAAWGWRAAFFIAGIPGIVLALVLLATTREPARRTADDRIADLAHKAPSPLTCLKFFWSQRSLMLIYAANALSSAAILGVFIWLPSFLIRVHGLSLSQAGLTVGVVTGVGTTVGSLAGGFVGDRVTRTNFLRLPYVPAAAILAVALAGMGMVLAGSTAVAVALMFVLQTSQNFHSAPSYALGQSLVGARMRGTANAVTLVLSNLLGYGIGPGLVGYLSDHVYAPLVGEDSIRYAMLTATFIGLVSAGLFALSARPLKRDLERAAAMA